MLFFATARLSEFEPDAYLCKLIGVSSAAPVLNRVGASERRLTTSLGEARRSAGS